MVKLLRDLDGFNRLIAVAVIIFAFVFVVVIVHYVIYSVFVTPSSLSGLADSSTSAFCENQIRQLVMITSMEDVSTNASRQDLIRGGHIDSDHQCPTGGVYSNNNGRWSCSIHLVTISP